MKRIQTFVGVLFALLVATSPVSAAPLTPCSGSWDGVGMTACELLGTPGEIFEGQAAQYDFSKMSFDAFPLYEITAYNYSNTLAVTETGALRYQPRAEVDQVFFSNDPHGRKQFAWWQQGNVIVVGIEDLVSKHRGDGDDDYNDYVVRFRTKTESVPEPTTLALLSIGLLGVGRAMRRRR